MRDDDRWPDDWHDSRQAVVAGGVAALILIGVLIYAVMQVAESSHDRPPLPNLVPTSSSATATSGLKTPESTSYTVPRAQTSEPLPPPAPGPTAAAPSDDGPAEQSTATTTTDPYATPSSSSSAGHI